jgi:predicted phosphate transport protein (TIGR00153 family)
LVSIPGVTFSRKEPAILRRMVDNVILVRRTEQALPDLVAAVAGGDVPGWMRKRDDIFEVESKAAGLHRELSAQIAEGAFFGGVREDILGLISMMYSIADSAKDAARLITLAPVTNQRAVEVLRSSDMGQFLASLDDAVVALQSLVEAFAIDRKTVLERVHVVENYEESADVFKNNMLQALFQKDGGAIDPVTLLLVRDFLFCADDVADRAEDASDIALVLVAKGYG